MDVKVIDVSKHNGSVDFVKVKEAGYYGVIIRAGYGRVISQKDSRFEEYYAAAKAAGLRIGAYWYSYAQNPSEAALEASVFASAIRGKEFELPVYYDIEEASQVKLGKTICSAMIDAFCTYMEREGYFAGIYSFDSFFSSNIEPKVQSKYTCWVARVPDIKPKYCLRYDMWQYTWKAAVPGMNGDVDVSHMYYDFEDVIKRAGLNGFGNKETYTITASVSGLSKGDAMNVANACKRLNMAVTQTVDK